MAGAPDNNERIAYIGETDFRNRRQKFGIKNRDRSKHMYVIGKTGMGKSTLLENMAIQDIVNGEGIAFIDPHGSSADKLLDYVPEDRVDDVLYFAPFDMDRPVGFNIMEDVGEDRRHLVVNGLMSTFEKIWIDAWSSRMAYILQNTIGALLEYPEATLLGVNRMYTDKEYRKKVVENVTDPSVKSFWTEEFAKYTDRYTQEATPAIQNKIGQFTANPLIRNIVGQPDSTFNIREMMDDRKLLIINLSKGQVGEGNAKILGSMLITKIYLAALSRADVPDSELAKLPSFYLYVDEFQSFANKSFEDILSEARKYKLSLTLAHQYVEQMDEEVRAAVFGNVGSTISFRVGPLDAELLEKVFTPTFYAEDLVNLGFAQVYLTLMINGVGCPPFSATTLPPIEPPEISQREAARAASREKYTRSRAEVEELIRQWHHENDEAQQGTLSGGEQQSTDKKPPVKRTAPAKQKRDEGGAPKPARRPAGGRGGGTQSGERPPVKQMQRAGDNNSRTQLREALSSILGQTGKGDAPASKEQEQSATEAGKKDAPGTDTTAAKADVKKAPAEVSRETLEEMVAVEGDDKHAGAREKEEGKRDKNGK